ncbi:unnamed protein product [Kuraishia capsulata CBS 1993]|uniref:non-specific serine/threonine protein kinase n=1 Tax=Kuraishia capsulata CBS 1993 TaxID=1382522 RepID=W6MJP4_9ASCO|nr:uncharacterized protein KUCA_T00002179001 [Kuraishia capsulata CBS 1993]CDK26208.1 unnamed protein product [Kuraishia capsulata CBS 1993]
MSNIADDFQPLEIIGRGSFGCVRKVRRKSDGKIFGRKEISYVAMNSKEKQQLSAEFRILRELKHQNIVQYIHHDHIPEEHVVHLYMEYCDGGDLSTVIKNYKQRKEYVPEEMIWPIFTQVLLALYRCHNGFDIPAVSNVFQSTPEENAPKNIDQGSVVIHRDIKPDNIFLLKDSSVKLGDFGLAKMLKHENEFAKTYVGTPYYMSPEVLVDKPYSPVCDIWSLGCVMYEMCSLAPPFQAKTHFSLHEKIKAGTFNPIPEHYSHRLKMVINACLITDPEERASANQLLQDSSFKIFRKELELSHRENELWKMESQLTTREKKLKAVEDVMYESMNKELEHQRELMELEVDEIRRSYRNEFQFVLEQQVEQQLSNILGKKVTLGQAMASKPKTTASLASPSPFENITIPSSPSMSKLQGPRQLSNDDRLRRPLGLIQDLGPKKPTYHGTRY